MNRTASRQLSTAARVYPSYLPYLHNNAKSRSKKWIPAVATAAGVGTAYGVAAYREAMVETHLEQQQQREAEADRQARRQAAMADAFGGASSLEELEHAMRVYEAQQSNQ
ncbi:N-acetylglucosaminyl-phosphatidylinositol [Diplogelasinospora grovesii]|uniref:N-acetylglucosaminyl-phosphatidylinositol n=1 Tax=Diplogelasinospora grovesii TaxID=303347 RepID=A0AAN6RZF2_9PEZI|nr:N-acetylglucosaminyl-phosphatidylinositol [Diplogelasinospora grovesii]